ncbi:hypothetical protein GGI11_000611 [Coemansia sp. RSA 2049]|nr:hypothetical protein GGI11_000611 [Coemansia sp. RSA 2049]
MSAEPDFVLAAAAKPDERWAGFGDHSSSSKSIADLRGSAERQQQIQQSFYSGRKAARLLESLPYLDTGGVGVEKREGAGEKTTVSVGGGTGRDYLNSSDIGAFIGLSKGLSFLDSEIDTATPASASIAEDGRDRNMSTADRSGSDRRAASRPMNTDEQSRYERVGYPKSTRSMSVRDTSSIDSRDTQRSQGTAESVPSVAQKKKKKRELQSRSHSRLKGFEMRVIDTHNGKAVVHAPILTKPTVGSDRENTKRDGAPDLPPPSAVELRYNAQRALISTTSILRTTVRDRSTTTAKDKSDSQRSQSKHADAADIAAVLRAASARDSREPAKKHAAVRTANGAATRDGSRVDGGQSKADAFLEQGRASTGSSLEQWGIVTSASLLQTKIGSGNAPMALAEQGSLLEHDEGVDSDGCSSEDDAVRLVENITRGCTMSLDSMTSSSSPRLGNRNSSILVSDESRRLIESIFSGRLSIGSNATGATERQRLSRYSDLARTSPRSISSSIPAGTAHAAKQQHQQEQLRTTGPEMPLSQQENNPSEHEQHSKNKRSSGSGQQQSSHDQESAAQEHSDRDGSKMRKPSFWSIFRGGSQKKEQSDDKKDASSIETPTTPQQPRQNFLRKQQSSSSGFADNFGFSRLLSLSDNKGGSGGGGGGASSASGNLFANKALPSVPQLPHPQSNQHSSPQNQHSSNTLSSASPDDHTMTTEGAAVSSSSVSAQNNNINNNNNDSTCAATGSSLAQQATAGETNITLDLDSTRSYDDARSGVNPSIASIASPTEGTQESGGYYTPSQEFFSLSSAGDRRDEAANKDSLDESAAVEDTGAGTANRHSSLALVQGPDTQSACTPGESPVLITNTLRTDSAAADSDKMAAVDGTHAVAVAADNTDANVVSGGGNVRADDDSDIVPLAQSRVLMEAHARDTAGAHGSEGNGSAAAMTSGGLGISTSLSASVNDNDSSVSDAKTRKVPHPINTAASYDSPLELDNLPSTARLRFSPDNNARELSSASIRSRSIQKEIFQDGAELEQQQITPAPSTATADVADEPSTDAAAQAAKAQEESSAQASAMGKYLFDVEESYCNYYSSQTGGSGRKAGSDKPHVEPPKPEILEGFDIPHLVDHAEWLGKRQIFNGLVLRYYISNYEFAGMRIDECLRCLCSHIYLRGESQVIDRLLVALSQRYVECNPDTTLKTSDVAHAVTYSTLLLNTDLHIADIRPSDRMTKSRFVRNTIDTIAQFQSTTTTVTATATGSGHSQPDTVSRAQTDSSEMPPQLPELDLSKMSSESLRKQSLSQLNGGAATPQSAVSRLLHGDSDRHESSTAQHNEGGSSGLRSLVGSMTSLNIGQSNTTVSRTSRDVVRLMGARGKRFSFFESSSAGNNNSSSSSNNNSVIANGSSGAGISGVSQAQSIGIASGIQSSSSVTQGISSPSSLRAFDRLRRKVSTNGAHSRSRSGTVSMDESPIGLNNRPSMSGSSLHSHSRDLDGVVASASRSASGSGAAVDVVRPNAAMPNLTELSSVLKDVYAGIKSKPLGQPSFARQASLMYEQQQQQQQMHNHPGLHGSHYSATHGLAHDSHDPLQHMGNMRSSMAFGSSGKHSLEIDVSMHGYGRHHAVGGQAPHTAYGEYDAQSIQGGGGSGRPSSVRSMPLHSVQRSRSITSMNKASGLAAGVQAIVRRPPQHPDPRVSALGAEAVKRSGSSMINFGGHNAGGTMRSSPSSASMGGGYLPSTAYTAYIRSPLENQHIRSGVLVRKHLFERAGKKASHRAWRTCYVSVDRGTVAMYKMDGRHGGHPDGRELTDTSLQLGSVSLRHTMTHMLPSPGYSRARPHVFALQLPSGGVYLFQTASEVELRDWVAACNYWAARESKAPYMIGGVYNMEYGWDNTGDYMLRYDEREAREDRGEELSAAEQAAEERRVAGERDASKGVSILEWTPPNNPMLRSDLDEPAQLKALLHHIAYLEEELVSHKKVQGSIDERFYPKTQQHHKAFSNWERKAQYILQELIKYQSYADVLQTALRQMQEEMAIPIPEELSADGSTATTVNGGGMHSATPASAIGATGGTTPHAEPHSDVAGTPPAAAPAAGFSSSRTSLPRKTTTDSNGNPLSSKSLPIKELLAPASEKTRNRASVIINVLPPGSSSSAASSSPIASALGGDRRRGSHQQQHQHQQTQVSASTGAINSNSSAAPAAADADALAQTSMPHLQHHHTDPPTTTTTAHGC